MQTNKAPLTAVRNLGPSEFVFTCHVLDLVVQYNAYLLKCLQALEPEMNISTRLVSDQHRVMEPRSQNKRDDRSFANCAPRLYNKLPSEIKEIENIQDYKSRLKTRLFGRVYDSTESCIEEEYRV